MTVSRPPADQSRFAALGALALIAAAMSLRCAAFDAHAAGETLGTMKQVATALSTLLATASTLAYVLPFPPLRWGLLLAAGLLFSSAAAPLVGTATPGLLTLHDMYQPIEREARPTLELQIESSDPRLATNLWGCAQATLEIPVRGCRAAGDCSISARFGANAWQTIESASLARPEWVRYELSDADRIALAESGQLQVRVASRVRPLTLYARDTGVNARSRRDTIAEATSEIGADGIVFVRFLFTDASGRPLAVMY